MASRKRSACYCIECCRNTTDEDINCLYNCPEDRLEQALKVCYTPK